MGRCRVRHWLLRVLTAEDVRRGLEEGLADTAAALQELMDADGAADVVSLVVYVWVPSGGGQCSWSGVCSAC